MALLVWMSIFCVPAAWAPASASRPGRAWAIFRKRAFTLYPALAEVSMKRTLYSLAFFSPSSMDTCLGV